jgi:uncharacterized membrane protein
VDLIPDLLPLLGIADDAVIILAALLAFLHLSKDIRRELTQKTSTYVWRSTRVWNLFFIIYKPKFWVHVFFSTPGSLLHTVGRLHCAPFSLMYAPPSCIHE